jgi:catechol 2,3-dioxygenase-like lactoylglutathione lyase family enzyme
MTNMNLGWCDICLRVASTKASRAFYEKLGFRRVEGDDDQGWAVMTNGDQRLGLYEGQHMAEAFSVNFRGGDVVANAALLCEKGVAIEKGPIQGPRGGWSAWIKDPDGNTIFLDTEPGETKRV